MVAERHAHFLRCLFLILLSKSGDSAHLKKSMQVLCFIQNHCSTHSRDELLMILGGFYHGDEIVEAKMKLFDLVECHPGSTEGMPHLITRNNRTINRNLTAKTCWL